MRNFDMSLTRHKFILYATVEIAYSDIIRIASIFNLK